MGLSLHWESGLKPTLRVGATRPKRLSLHWESGLKLAGARAAQDPASRLSLHWESGLKPVQRLPLHRCEVSLPSLGEWIETARSCLGMMSVWSLPSLGEWIETCAEVASASMRAVSPFIGRVD